MSLVPRAPAPHGKIPAATSGAPLDAARAAAVLAHGRGAAAEDMLGLARALVADGPPELADVAFVAPRAADHAWYPRSFLAPTETNEPALSSALAVLESLVEQLAAAGLPPDRVVLGGFSQGACLALEFAARAPRRYGGLVGLSGGLIGPPGTERRLTGSLGGTPGFLGCSDRDPHVPLARVEETAALLEGIGGRVETRIYPGMGHTVNEDELDAARGILVQAVA